MPKTKKRPPRKRAVKRAEPRSLPQPDNPHEPVWRYMDLAKYVDLLARKKLHLARVDVFSDPFEATLPQRNGRTLRKRLHLFRQARRNTYASCWRRGADESEAMWKLYCGNAGGVAIVVPYGDLRKTALDAGCDIGLVRYIDYSTEEFPDATDAVWASMNKRVAFAHEREVRIVCHQRMRGSAKREPPSGVDIEWDPERWVRRIVLSPLSEDYFYAAVEKVTEALAPRLKDRFVPSQMLQVPNL
jgi:hypothetical protein